jgi:transcriptional regulator with XRE-family HTH domain
MEERKTPNKDLVFGRRLQRVRKRMGFTQEKLAEKTRLSTTFIGLIETGRRRPSLKSLQKIADALGINIKELF